MYCNQCGAVLSSDSRFCASCGRTIGNMRMMPAENRVARHLHLLGILWVASGALSLLSAAGAWFFSNQLLPWLGLRVPAFLPSLIGGIAVLAMVKGAACILAGWGLFQRESWARMLAVVLGFISLLNVPFGTALGIYTLWVLLPERNAREYERLALAA